MDDSGWEPTEDDFPIRRSLTDEQVESLYYRLDIKRDTTRDGKLRCTFHYKGIDDFGDVEWMRCTEAAKLRVLIEPEGGGKPYWALVCYGCCPHADQIEELNIPP